ncbi:neuronal acetylcholine receptor subunit alpha-2 [Plakobranchus ocellatus]|uniref:Neuronal acetylcholine receptor subunit alpha-2 n=1 Tax=Plakobranchus ocellatus TaxID=259542 RepID=A0AAV3Z7D3_9GAST|nr:neuronal acetylcholine receptor subunit alpha-2 [Plakobranchus ocellatus]
MGDSPSPVFDYSKVKPDPRHLSWVLPSSKRGMQATMHTGVPRRLLPADVCHDAEEYLATARRILHRQRMVNRMLPRFNRAKSANYAALLKEIHEAESSQIDHAHLPKFSRSVEAYQVPVFPGRRYTPSDVDRIVERLSTYDPEKVPESRGFHIKFETPVYYKKKYTEDEMDAIVNRLAAYNPEKGPAESKGVPPVALPEPHRSSMFKVKRCTSQEVQEIVERLSAFDPARWPPGSRSGIKGI